MSGIAGLTPPLLRFIRRGLDEGTVMPSPLVLVANEPRAYRETIALALKALRPEAEVIAIEPTDLDAEVKRRWRMSSPVGSSSTRTAPT
jgi:hypothetical protein